MANIHAINTFIRANLKLLRVELGTMLCSEVQQDIPTPPPGLPSAASPNPMSIPREGSPSYPAAGMMTQLPYI